MFTFKGCIRHVLKLKVLILFVFPLATYILYLESNKIPSSFASIYIDFNTSKFDDRPKIESISKECNENFCTNLSSFPIDIECIARTGVVDSKTKEKDEDFEFLKTEEGKLYKKILFFYHKYPRNNGIGFGHKTFSDNCCMESRCFITDNKTALPLSDFDAVIFQHSVLKTSIIPKVRPKNQIWIFHEREPALYQIRGLERYFGLFNWTMTYKRDSDIPYRYGHIFSKQRSPEKLVNTLERNSLPLQSLLKTKTKMAAWMVSHCTTLSGREAYVKQLKEYIEIDIYGKCGTLTCLRNSTYKCFEDFEKIYKFYLSFENSLCDDYISEKFFIILRYNMIPVVLGGGDYSSFAPPHSYINTMDFHNAAELANYLKYLNSNDTAYMEYFRWKNDYVAAERVIGRKIGICTLCQKLHEEKKEKNYENMKSWYYDQSHCINCSPLKHILMPRKKECLTGRQSYFKNIFLG